METKFIGLEGFNEIESLSTKNKSLYSRRPAKLTTAQKTVRFIKRATTLCVKSIKSKQVLLTNNVSKKANKVTTAKRANAHGNSTSSSRTRLVKERKPQLSLLDKCYLENRKGHSDEYSNALKGAIVTRMTPNNRKYAHSASQTSTRTHASLKKKAVLAFAASTIAVMLSCVTVAGAVNLSGNTESVVQKSPVISTAPTEATEPVENDYSYAFIATSDEAIVAPVSTIGEDMSNVFVGLYIDDELIGVTNEGDALNAALEKLLVDYREGYDDKTTTEFANDVDVRNGKFETKDVMSAEEIMAAAEGKFSISLSTDIVYTRDIKYEVETEYDDSKDSSYKKVTTEGENGTEEVTVRTTYTDGMQTDAVETETKVIKEAVDEVVVRGSKNGKPASTESSSSSSSSGSSSGSFMWPVPYTRNITSYYAWRWGRMHWGIDIAAGGVNGQAIVASDGGTVTFAGNNGDGYGYYVIVDHGNGFQTLYAHCSSLAVSAGQHVSQGETIGYVGSTGNSTGPHLHFEVRQGSNKLNPLDYVG